MLVPLTGNACVGPSGPGISHRLFIFQGTLDLATDLNKPLGLLGSIVSASAVELANRASNPKAMIGEYSVKRNFIMVSSVKTQFQSVQSFH